MKNLFLTAALCLWIITGCKNKKNTEEENPVSFPVLSFIKSQVAHVDTSLYPIVKIVTADSVPDTTYIPREEFRAAARDFLEIPDLTDKKWKGLYTETRIYDESINRVIITYLPVKDEYEVSRQEVLIIPGGDSPEGKVSSLYIDLNSVSANSSVTKKLLWLADESFQVVTITRQEGKPEQTVTTQVIWNRRENY